MNNSMDYNGAHLNIKGNKYVYVWLLSLLYNVWQIVWLLF
jgi:hypothetical protein